MRNTGVLPVRLRQKMLRAVLEFMASSGLTESEIRVSFEQELKELRSWRRSSADCRKDGNYVGNGNVSAELLRVWHRDDRYLDDNAAPKPLPLKRARDSVSSIIMRLDPLADAEEIIRSMKVVGLIRRVTHNRYVPTAESVTIGQLHPLAVEHVAKSVVRLVSTVCRNTDPARRSMPLIERYAYVPDLDGSERQAFAEFSRTQGMVYLEAIDDWLEQRRSRRQSKATGSRATAISAGVHLVAYLGDGAEGRIAGQEPSKRSITDRQAPVSLSPRTW